MFCVIYIAFGQEIPERASYPIDYFSPSEFNGHPQSWDVEGDNNGVVYFANSGGQTGLVRFDGIRWTQYPLDGQSAAFSLAVGRQDTVYVGGQGEIGYFAENNSQEYVYHSYMHLLPDTLQTFNNVWFTHKTDDFVLYNSGDHLFLFQDNRLLQTFTYDYFGFSFLHEGTVWVKREGGFYKIAKRGNTFVFEKVPGTEQLSEELIYTAFPVNDSTLVFSYRGSVPLLYSLSRQELSPLETSVDQQLRDDWIYGGTSLQNGGLLLHSVSHGVYLFSEEGRLIEIIDRGDGLYNQEVYASWEDEQQNIWFALNNGLAVARPFSPLKTFWEGYGFSGGVEHIKEVNGTLFISTQQGIYKAEDLYEAYPQFHRISREPAQYFEILQFEDELLIAGSNAGLVVHDLSGQATETLWRYHTEFITKLPVDNDALMASGRGNMYLLQKENGSWKEVWQIEDPGLGFRNMISTISSRDPNKLIVYIGTTSDGLYQISIDPNDLSITEGLKKTSISSGQQFPPGPVEIYKLSDRPVLGTTSGLFDMFENASDTVSVQRNQLMEFIGNSASNKPFRVFENNTKTHIWVSGDDELTSFEITDGDTTMVFPDILHEVQIGDIHTILEDQEGVLWLGGMDGLARYLPEANELTTESPHKTYIRAWTAGSDSVLTDKYLLNNHAVELPFRENSLEFSFNSNFYHPNFRPLFAWQLDGVQSGFSDFSETNTVSVQNLSPGTYTLRVISRNSLGAEAEEATFEFAILKPWYTRWWFILLYILLGIGGVFGLVYLRSYNLKKKRDELEAVVQKRTREVVEQKEQIEELADELRRIDALKTRYFANISHELRTPLTLMLNPLNDLLNATDIELPRDWRNKLEIASKNTKRLKKLVDEILDLIKLESGMLEVNPEKVNVHLKTRQVVSMFESMAEVKEITLSFHTSVDESFGVLLDSNKYEHIVNNLISNAIKFTPEHGKVDVELFCSENLLTLVVTDNGRGIEQEDLPRIFDRFYKAGRTDDNSEGMGIGLALSSQLARLLGGDLHAESQVGSGSEFTLTLPVLKTDDTFLQEDLPKVAQPVGAVDAFGKQKNIAQPGNVHRETILVVEDNLDMQRYLRSILETTYHVETAGSGKKGLQQLEKTECSLVISDIMMPEMDGLTFAREVRKQNRYQNIPIIFLSARADIGFRVEGLRVGVEDYLVKPFNNDELCVRIENLLRNRRRILHTLQENGGETKEEVPLTESDQFLEKTREIVQDNIEDSGFTVSKLAAEVYHSERQLNRKLQSLTGYTPAEYIKQIRLQYARTLIEQKKYTSVAEIARAVGYSKPDYFSALYKKAFGSSPSSHF